MKKIIWLVLFVVTGSMGFAQGKDAVRKIDFTQVLRGFDGKPINVGDAAHPKDLTLGDACVGALETPLDADRPDTGEVKFKRDQLARKIYGAKGAELHPEDLALIKERIGKVYGPLVVGAAWPLLDPLEK